MSFSVYLPVDHCAQFASYLNRLAKAFDNFILTTPALYERWWNTFVKRPTRSPGCSFWSPYDPLAPR